MPTFKDALVRRLGGYSPDEMAERASEAYAHGYNDSGEDEPVSGTTAKYGYRRQTTSGLRDFTLIDPEQVLQIVWVLWQSNPIVKRASQIKRDYILGRGVYPQTKDPDLQEILDAFWDVNDLDERQKEFVLQMFLFGEQIYPVFIRKTDGRVKLGYIDPAEVEVVITDPENAMEMWAVVVKPTNPANSWEKEKPTRVYRIIRQEEHAVKALSASEAALLEQMQEQRDLEVWDPEQSNVLQPVQDTAHNKQDANSGDMDALVSKLYQIADRARPNYQGKLVTAKQAILQDWEREMLASYSLSEYTGSCFFFRVNSVSNQPRGFSDFLQVADWVDQHDVTLFNLADREQLSSFFSWDVTLKNADDAKVRERGKELAKNPPRRGSVNVHNDAEEWDMTYPDVQATNSIEAARALQLQVLGGLGYPEHWFGKGDETNRATAQAQGDPTWKTLEHDQGIAQKYFLKILQFVRDQAEIAGSWKEGTDEESGDPYDSTINLPMPEMTVKDTSMVASMLTALSSAIMVAEEQGWIDSDKAREIWAKGLQELGIELDLSQEVEPDEDEDPEDEGPKAKQGQGWGEADKSFFNQHAPMLPDGENAEQASNWGDLSPDNKQELLATFLERLGYPLPHEEMEYRDLFKQIG